MNTTNGFNQREYYWIHEMNAHFTSGKFQYVPISEYYGSEMISYLRHQVKLKNHIRKSQYVKNAITRKLKQFEGVLWNHDGFTTRHPRKQFNYHKKLFG